MSRNRTVLCIGDSHLPFEHPKYLDFCKRIHKEFKCTDVVHIGDLVDNHAISYHEHDPNGWSPEDEMKEADKHLKEWFSAFPVVKLCRGNHDCYSDDTEILTTNGWKLGADLKESDVVATLNLKTNEIEYQKPYALINKSYNGEMIRFSGQNAIDLLVTPGHRMVISSKDTKITDPIYHIKKAHELNMAYRYFPVSAENKRKDCQISDSQIKLIAWVLTDGYIKDKGYVICQSKIENLEHIKNVLSDNLIQFKEKKRDRNITHICGKELKKKPLTQHEYIFKSDFLDFILCGNKKDLPKIVKLFSKRQFDIFINEMVRGDGTDYGKIKKAKSMVLHGEQRILNQVQEMCVLNSYHASMRVFRTKDYRLNIVPNRIKVGHTSGSDVVWYSGNVWCASVDNGTLVVRRNGNVAIQGNCLVDRKSKTAGLPSRAFRNFRDIWNLPKGWVDDFSFIIDGVKYIHGTGYSGDFAHLKAAIDNRMSVVMGHLHSSCGIEYSANELDCVFGMQVGCGIDRKSYAFEYGRDFKKKPILSCGIVEYTKYGANPRVFKMEL